MSAALLPFPAPPARCRRRKGGTLVPFPTPGPANRPARPGKVGLWQYDPARQDYVFVHAAPAVYAPCSDCGEWAVRCHADGILPLIKDGLPQVICSNCYTRKTGRPIPGSEQCVQYGQPARAPAEQAVAL